ncbi:hypothetical protein ACRRTK_022762 [Alexandromys fortis]
MHLYIFIQSHLYANDSLKTSVNLCHQSWLQPFLAGCNFIAFNIKQSSQIQNM